MGQSFRGSVMGFWRGQQATVPGRDVDVDAAIEFVLADPALTRNAVAFAVKRLRSTEVDRYARGTLTRSGFSDGRPGARLVDDLIEHGLTLLDMRCGRLKLGDYLPTDLREYGLGTVEGGKTAIVRGRFAVAVANACSDNLQIVRAQLSLADIERIRCHIVDKLPGAEQALSVA